jgi:hypothetical protein
MHQK